MFDSLSNRLQDVFRSLRGEARLTEETVEVALREIRMALLEADVNFKVVKAFIDRVRDRAVDQEVLKSLTPGAAGRPHRARRDAGAVRRHRRRAAAVAGAAARHPAARPPGLGQDDDVGQARALAGEAGAASAAGLDRRAASGGDRAAVGRRRSRPACACTIRRASWIRCARAAGALAEARNSGFDVVIVDTAGRLHIDDELMDELQAIKAAVQPTDLLYVADAMTGQDAIKSAGEFNRRIGVTGVVLTKMDGDARGGAALSVVGVVGVPIAFVGSGERLQDLEPFHPDRVVSRVLGMGDVLSLIEKAEEAVSIEDAEKLEAEDPARRVHARGLPRSAADDQEDGAARADPRDAAGHGQPEGARRPNREQVDDKQLGRVEAIINSMTPKERREPPADQRQPPQAHREGQRHVGRGGQPAAEAVRADEEDAEAARRHGRARRRKKKARPRA